MTSERCLTSQRKFSTSLSAKRSDVNVEGKSRTKHFLTESLGKPRDAEELPS